MTRRKGAVLLVDDEEKLRKTLGRALRADGHDVVDAPGGRRALTLLGERPFDVLLADNMMPGMTGLELIREYVESRVRGSSGVSDDPAHVILMTAHATVDSAIDAMKLGAFDYLRKPFEIDELLASVARALDHQRLRTECRYLRSERDEQFDHYGIVGCSPAMRGVIERIDRVAETKSTVLVTGETGTGKELVARAIHDRSEQRDMPLVKVNCAAIPETVLESELFGH
ncbi:MAG TPA: sigma 54-interacting transcriptional regulator, partial [Vicinamibacterales bacterium]|nr:sigma 54-interacting transcriptional regulator [Vicinamibacterales bacterium]